MTIFDGIPLAEKNILSVRWIFSKNFPKDASHWSTYCKMIWWYNIFFQRHRLSNGCCWLYFYIRGLTQEHLGKCDSLCDSSHWRKTDTKQKEEEQEARRSKRSKMEDQEEQYGACLGVGGRSQSMKHERTCGQRHDEWCILIAQCPSVRNLGCHVPGLVYKEKLFCHSILIHPLFSIIYSFKIQRVYFPDNVVCGSNISMDQRGGGPSLMPKLFMSKMKMFFIL